MIESQDRTDSDFKLSLWPGWRSGALTKLKTQTHVCATCLPIQSTYWWCMTREYVTQLQPQCGCLSNNYSTSTLAFHQKTVTYYLLQCSTMYTYTSFTLHDHRVALFVPQHNGRQMILVGKLLVKNNSMAYRCGFLSWWLQWIRGCYGASCKLTMWPI
jgi:hypothetical protein